VVELVKEFILLQKMAKVVDMVSLKYFIAKIIRLNILVGVTQDQGKPIGIMFLVSIRFSSKE
jgi:hypothetical protein